PECRERPYCGPGQLQHPGSALIFLHQHQREGILVVQLTPSARHLVSSGGNHDLKYDQPQSGHLATPAGISLPHSRHWSSSFATSDSVGRTGLPEPVEATAPLSLPACLPPDLLFRSAS